MDMMSAKTSPLKLFNIVSCLSAKDREYFSSVSNIAPANFCVNIFKFGPVILGDQRERIDGYVFANGRQWFWAVPARTVSEKANLRFALKRIAGLQY